MGLFFICSCECGYEGNQANVDRVSDWIVCPRCGSKIKLMLNTESITEKEHWFGIKADIENKRITILDAKKRQKHEPASILQTTA